MLQDQLSRARNRITSLIPDRQTTCKLRENKLLIIYDLHARKARLQHPMDISVQAKSKTPHISAYFNTIISNIRTMISMAMVIQLPFPLLFLATLPSLVLARSSVL
jgi:hypothetical protein